MRNATAWPATCVHVRLTTSNHVIGTVATSLACITPPLYRIQIEVEDGGDLAMKSCNLSLRPPAASHTRSLPLEPSADTDMDSGGGSRPAPAPAPPRDCSVALVHDGGRATFDDCSFRGSPLSYGVVARDSGTRVSESHGRPGRLRYIVNRRTSPARSTHMHAPLLCFSLTSARSALQLSRFPCPTLKGNSVPSRPLQVLLENCQVSGNRCSNVLACDGAHLSLLRGCRLSDSVEGYGLAATDKHTTVYCTVSEQGGGEKN